MERLGKAVARLDRAGESLTRAASEQTSYAKLHTVPHGDIDVATKNSPIMRKPIA